ncbi:MAG TPA: molybdenum cofactor biosynthesis protein MoaE [Terriglobales bacterium]|nr:molybdenum cofactor biosynthesis protein MoaE [Terriglobales bacterium]
MQVKVLFFGVLKEMAGRASEGVELAEGATLSDLLERYEKEVPKLKQYRGSIALSVNQEYAAASTRLKNGDEIGLLPPVSGGADEEPLVRIVHERIDPHQIVTPLERPEDGAIVMFDGIVRDNSRGRRTLYLDYEAYEEMALKQMRGLAAQAKERFAIRNVAIVHRLGRLQISESSVFIAVFSAHRGAAFEACRWIIDSLKKTVPIWKKEYFEDGAVWADGEPFPEEIRRGDGTKREERASK